MKHTPKHPHPKHSDAGKHHKKDHQHSSKQQHHSGKETRTEEKKKLTGIIRTTGKGTGFVEIEGYDEDIIIEPDFLNTALNGDEVEILLAGKIFETKKIRHKQSTQSQEGSFGRLAGQVLKVLKRSKEQFVGILEKKDGNYGVKPDDRKFYTAILIPVNKDVSGPLSPKDELLGKKVLVKITSWKVNEQYPTGEIVQILGNKGDHETEMQSIILDRGIDTNFPPDVDKEADEIEKTEKPLRQDEIAKRKDFRNTTTFTIDPVDAKDFDDAISLKELGNGLYEIGVHIADVSHYVREGTALDREALKRSFSVYLVDRTIPMLPEVLSNDLCSLNPNEDKFAFSSVFVMDANGNVSERWFGKTVINSNKRFSYEAAQEVLNNKSGEYFTELNILNQISYKLREVKYRMGAIDFEQDEVKFKLDESGKPLGVYRKERLDTHKLVEEYMLLANREVAEFIYNKIKNKQDTASIYRIHDVPDKDRIEDLALFLKALGYDLPIKQGKVTSQDINTLLKSIEGKPEESLIKTATIRSMAKAIYSPKNIGHFGLAFEYYTHFTSPIRRYPDLMIHRILENVLVDNQKRLKDEFSTFSRISNHATEKEIAAAEAERASIKYKQVEYMSEHVGETFEGIISGVTEWGIYIEEKNTKCEGMNALRELGNDYYIFNRKTYSIEGEKTKKKFRLGDTVQFKVMKADLDAKTLDYKILI